LQLEVLQSVFLVQARPRPHLLHKAPPQSTSLSSPFFTRSVHDATVQSPAGRREAICINNAQTYIAQALIFVAHLKICYRLCSHNRRLLDNGFLQRIVDTPIPRNKCPFHCHS
jgi:hypothetical protein